MVLRFLFLTGLLLGSSACQSSVSWVPDGDGRVYALHHQTVRLPGLTYLKLGGPQTDTLSALRSRGFDCNEEASTAMTIACVRAPGTEDPTGGVVMLEFRRNLLSGVQAQLEAQGDRDGVQAQKRFDTLNQEWSNLFGPGELVKRPGIVATRRTLPDGSALLSVLYPGEATLVVEHLGKQLDSNRLPTGPR